MGQLVLPWFPVLPLSPTQPFLGGRESRKHSFRLSRPWQKKGSLPPNFLAREYNSCYIYSIFV